MADGMIEPYWISQAPGEFLIYLWFMGLVHAVVVEAVLLFATPLFFVRRRAYLVFVRGFFVFNILLLCVSVMLNALWSCTIWGNLYFSTDYVVDFIPVWPITQHRIDFAFNDTPGQILHGLSIWHVRAVWLAFAFAAWAVTAFLYSRIRRIWNKGTLNKTAAIRE